MEQQRPWRINLKIEKEFEKFLAPTGRHSKFMRQSFVRQRRTLLGDELLRLTRKLIWNFVLPRIRKSGELERLISISLPPFPSVFLSNRFRIEAIIIVPEKRTSVARYGMRVQHDSHFNFSFTTQMAKRDQEIGSVLVAINSISLFSLSHR